MTLTKEEKDKPVYPIIVENGHDGCYYLKGSPPTNYSLARSRSKEDMDMLCAALNHYYSPPSEDIQAEAERYANDTWLNHSNPAIFHAAAQGYLAGASERTGWIEVSKELPDTNKDVLVDYDGRVRMSFYDKGFGWGGKNYPVTHWQPLPAAPTLPSPNK